MNMIKRRGLLKLGLLSPLSMLLTGCMEWITALFNPQPLLVPRQPASQFGKPITLPGTLADYPVGSVTRERRGKFYLSRVPEGFLALYWKCTHLGCTVPYKANEEFEGKRGVFMCPCHGSVYHRNGVNVAGPAPRPLDLMEVSITGNAIIVDTGKIRKRKDWNPSDAVKP